MTDETIKNILKIDLGISVDAYDNLIEPMIERAKSEIELKGIHLQDNVSDGMLIEQYAAWLLRKRKENVGIPQHLHHQLNNRLLSEKMNITPPNPEVEEE